MVEDPKSCYLSVRIKNSEVANKLQIELESRGIKVLNPCNIAPFNIPHQDIPKEIADACYRMMEESGCTVLVAGNGDDFGNDCATELGYTVASKKPVFILINNGSISTAQALMKNAMSVHSGDFSTQSFVDNITDLVKLIKQIED